MAFVVKDRVREVTSSTGTGAIALGGAVVSAAKGSFRAFGSGGAGIANGDTLPYLIEDGANWEIGIGTYVSSGNQLQRTSVASNSDGSTTPISLSGSAEVALVVTELAWGLKSDLASEVSLFSYSGVANANTTPAKTANDAALTSGRAASTALGFGAVDVPVGTYWTSTAPASLPPFGGRGNVVDSAGNKRGRFFSHISSEPATKGDYDSPETAFNGDLSYCSFPVEHRISGTALGDAPPTGGGGQMFDVLRAYMPEAYPRYTFVNASGGEKHDIFFTTAASGDHVEMWNNSPGDVFARTARLTANAVHGSYTSPIDNGWTGGSLTDVFAGRAGVTLMGHEVNFQDNGFDVGAVGYLIWGKRRSPPNTSYAQWVDYVAKASGGYEAHDAAFAVYGPYRMGLNLADADYSSNDGAAIVMSADQFIYFNAKPGTVPDDYRFVPGIVGGVGVGYIDGYGASLFNGETGIAVTDFGGVELQGTRLGFFGTAGVTKPTVTGSRGSNAALTSLLTALANLGLITNSSS